jgi:hypothetical protein
MLRIGFSFLNKKLGVTNTKRENRIFIEKKNVKRHDSFEGILCLFTGHLWVICIQSSLNLLRECFDPCFVSAKYGSKEPKSRPKQINCLSLCLFSTLHVFACLFKTGYNAWQKSPQLRTTVYEPSIMGYQPLTDSPSHPVPFPVPRTRP